MTTAAVLVWGVVVHTGGTTTTCSIRNGGSTGTIVLKLNVAVGVGALDDTKDVTLPKGLSCEKGLWVDVVTAGGEVFVLYELS